MRNDGGAHGRTWSTKSSPGAVRRGERHPFALGAAPEQSAGPCFEIEDRVGLRRGKDERERGRPKAPLVLSEEERDTLSRWARRPNSPQALALRSKIVLACAEGKTNEVVAAELRCSKPTVGKWRSRFVQKRLQGLADEYRPGVPRSITDDHVEAVVVKTLTEKPKDATHWSTRGMAKATGMST